MNVNAFQGFTHFKEITIDHTKVLDNFVNFSILFVTLDNDLTNCQTDGDDIVFYDKTGTTKLDHEIEKFNSAMGELVVWVRIPYLSNSTDTIFLMIYNNSHVFNSENPKGVWVEYDAVYHLSDFSDSIAMNHLRQVGAVFTNSNGKFAAAQQFDGYGMDFLTADTNYGINTSFSIECWIKIDGTDTDQTFVSLPHSYTGTGERLMLNWSDDVALARTYNTSNNGANTYGFSPINDNVWHYLVHTYDNQTTNLYIDGQLEGSDPYSGVIQCYYNRFFIGREGDYGAAKWQETVLLGLIDEVTVSKNVFSAAQISTEYNNQHDPSEFYSISSAIKFTADTSSTTTPTNTTTTTLIIITLMTPGFSSLTFLSMLLCILVMRKAKQNNNKIKLER